MKCNYDFEWQSVNFASANIHFDWHKNMLVHILMLLTLFSFDFEKSTLFRQVYAIYPRAEMVDRKTMGPSAESIQGMTSS